MSNWSCEFHFQLILHLVTYILFWCCSVSNPLYVQQFLVNGVVPQHYLSGQIVKQYYLHSLSLNMLAGVTGGFSFLESESMVVDLIWWNAKNIVSYYNEEVWCKCTTLKYTSSCEERVSGSIWTQNKCFWVVIHGFDTCNDFVWQAIDMKNVVHNTPVDTIKGFREVNQFYGGFPIGYLDLFNNSS